MMQKKIFDVNTLGQIGVLMGGCSSEREISLKSGRAVSQALKASGCDVADLDIKDTAQESVVALIKNAGIDIAFISLHGAFGEDGGIQTILEEIDLPYTGSGISASQKAINKPFVQKLLYDNNIPVAQFKIIQNHDLKEIEHILNQMSLPLVIKPESEGSSIGVTLVDEERYLNTAINKAFEYGSQVLVEEYIKGRELTVGILEEEALAPIEIVSKNTFFDFTAKYSPGMTDYIVPAKIEPQLRDRLKEIALQTHTILGCEDLSRVDFMVDENMNPYVLEINTIPGFTQTSLLPKAAALKGINFNQLCLKLLGLAYGKKKIKGSGIR